MSGGYDHIIGQEVDIVIDRPLGSVHPKHDFFYPINYGYVPGVMGGDGEEQDVYLLGVNVPVRAFSAVVIGVIHRLNDTEDKWVAAPKGISFSRDEIERLTYFQERFFETQIFC